MMRLLTVGQLIEIYDGVMQQSGGTAGVRDLPALESAAAQPCMTFGGRDLYPTLIERAAALAFSLINNHPFVDGNKRAAQAAMETFLMLNGQEIDAPVDEQEQVILAVAAGGLSREQFTEWLRSRVVKRRSGS